MRISLQQLLLNARGQGVPIANYLLDLYWRQSRSGLVYILAAILKQEEWHVAHGLAEFRLIHTENAALVVQVQALLNSAKIEVKAA